MIKLILRGVENYFKMAIFPTCRSTMNRTTQFDSITMYIVTMSKTNQSLRLAKKKERKKRKSKFEEKKSLLVPWRNICWHPYVDIYLKNMIIMTDLLISQQKNWTVSAHALRFRGGKCHKNYDDVATELQCCRHSAKCSDLMIN